MVVRTIDDKHILVNPLQVVDVEEQKQNEVYSVEVLTGLKIRIDRHSYLKLLTWFTKYERTLIK